MADPNADDLFATLRPSRFNDATDPNSVPQSDGPGSGNPQPIGWIQDGVVTATTFDTTAPAAPTGLSLSSDVVLNSDGGSFVRLLVGLVQPSDTDLYGSYVEVTSQNDGADPPNPVWDRPFLVLIARNQTQGRIDDVQGVTRFWARARAVDVLGNYSAFTSVVEYVTVGDTTAPPAPTAPTVNPGFRGFGAFWQGGDAPDLAFYELRWAQDSSPPPDGGSWTTVQVKGTSAFVGGLEDLLYWVSVRGVDTSGNTSAWSTSTSVTPTLIGAADVSFNSVVTNILETNYIDATTIETGTLRIKDAAAFADGIEVYESGGTLVGTWDWNGLKIKDPSNTARYVVLDGGQLKFTTDNGATFSSALTPDGLNATAITFGNAAGGHNLVSNSSFELAAFVAAGSTALFTDNSGTPGWKAANRTTAPVNTTEGAADLQVTAMAY
jgi:hypothetical protein